MKKFIVLLVAVSVLIATIPSASIAGGHIYYGNGSGHGGGHGGGYYGGHGGGHHDDWEPVAIAGGAGLLLGTLVGVAASRPTVVYQQPPQPQCYTVQRQAVYDWNGNLAGYNEVRQPANCP
jgi:hypothetical protein